MKKIAIFPGSFDPFTIGHQYIVEQTLELFDRVIIGVGYNHKKNGFLSVQNRTKLISDVFFGEKRVKVREYNSLTIDFCREVGASFIIRGLRNGTDLDMEMQNEAINRTLCPKIHTLYITTPAELQHISSSAVRELSTFLHPTSQMLPKGICLEDYL